jgi:hypothetical protein
VIARGEPYMVDLCGGDFTVRSLLAAAEVSDHRRLARLRSASMLAER